MAETKELSKDVRDKIVDLQDHRQAAWWEGDNSWCDYSQIEETQNNWGSMQDLTLWSFNENGEESAKNYTAAIKGTMDGAMYRQGQGIDNGSWMGIPAWQWSKTHGQGNKGVLQEEVA